MQTPSSRAHAQASAQTRSLQQGKRGGKFYLSAAGKKIYHALPVGRAARGLGRLMLSGLKRGAAGAGRLLNKHVAQPIVRKAQNAVAPHLPTPSGAIPVGKQSRAAKMLRTAGHVAASMGKAGAIGGAKLAGRGVKKLGSAMLSGVKAGIAANQKAREKKATFSGKGGQKGISLPRQRVLHHDEAHRLIEKGDFVGAHAHIIAARRADLGERAQLALEMGDLKQASAILRKLNGTNRGAAQPAPTGKQPNGGKPAPAEAPSEKPASGTAKKPRKPRKPKAAA